MTQLLLQCTFKNVTAPSLSMDLNLIKRINMASLVQLITFQSSKVQIFNWLHQEICDRNKNEEPNDSNALAHDSCCVEEDQHKTWSCPTLSQGKNRQTGKQRRRGCPNKQGSLRKWSQVQIERRCQVPGAIQASSGHVDGLPGQLS